MKTNRVISFLIMLMFLTGWKAVTAQSEREAVPGDHFSLEGALELFKKSSSPEEFERLLNSPESQVNNLDLNGDGDTDYIKVIDRYEGNVHAFILQAVISASEYQDVAVIELEKLANGKAVLQITGDEDIYGIETIIEPTEEVRVLAGTSTQRTVVNVWTWPAVQYVYSPYYYGWVSPYYWTYRPVWWRPWRPTTYIVYYSYWEPYRPYYSHCHTHRITYAQPIYRPYRSTSVIVYNRHHTQISSYRSLYSSSRFTRGRDDNRYNNTLNYREPMNGQSDNRDYGRSALSSERWRSQNNYNRGGRSDSRYQSNDGHRYAENRSSTEWKQNSNRSDWRQNPERKQFAESYNQEKNERNPSVENRTFYSPHSNPSRDQRNQVNGERQQVERKQSFDRHDGRPVYNHTSTQQRSLGHSENRNSSGNGNAYRPGSTGVGSKSTEHRRGRD